MRMSPPITPPMIASVGFLRIGEELDEVPAEAPAEAPETNIVEVPVSVSTAVNTGVVGRLSAGSKAKLPAVKARLVVVLVIAGRS